MVSAISIKNLTKSYGDLVAVKDLNLEIKKGEFFGYLGPNGAGKTTTINVLTGLSTYDKGTVKVFGADVEKDYQKARSLIGLSPQEFNFDPYFSIRRVLRYQAGFFGIPKKEALKKVDRVLEQMELDKKAKLDFKKLSGGMKRRLAIARALVHDPEILILDEPTAGLDVELRLELWDFIKKLNKDGKTILLTTHYIEEAQRLCNRIGIINKGSLIALDDKKKLMKELSLKHLRVETAKKHSKVPLAIKKLKEKSEVSENEIRINLDPKSDVDSIIKVVQKAVKIKDIRLEEESLEELFVRMIKNG